MAILDKANIQLNKVATSQFDDKISSCSSDMKKQTLEQHTHISKNAKTIHMIRANINPMLCKSHLAYDEDEVSVHNMNQVKTQILFRKPSEKGGDIVYQQLGFVDFVKAIKRTMEMKTHLPCYITIPSQISSPFCYIEGIEKKMVDSKSMWKEIFTVFIYIIGEPSDDFMKISNDIHELEQALKDGIALPQEYKLMKQTNNGIQMITLEDTKETHAVINYDFMISYGYKYKI